MHHAGSDWPGEHYIRHHSSLIPENRDLADAKTVAYGDCIALRSKKAAMSLQRGLDQKLGDLDGDATMEGGSIKGSDSAEKRVKALCVQTRGRKFS